MIELGPNFLFFFLLIFGPDWWVAKSLRFGSSDPPPWLFCVATHSQWVFFVSDGTFLPLPVFLAVLRTWLDSNYGSLLETSFVFFYLLAADPLSSLDAFSP